MKASVYRSGISVRVQTPDGVIGFPNPSGGTAAWDAALAHARSLADSVDVIPPEIVPHTPMHREIYERFHRDTPLAEFANRIYPCREIYAVVQTRAGIFAVTDRGRCQLVQP